MHDSLAAAPLLLLSAAAVAAALVFVMTVWVAKARSASERPLIRQMLGATAALSVCFSAVVASNMIRGTACTPSERAIPDVRSGSLAATLGFSAGDAIISARGAPGLGALDAALQSGEPFEATVRRGDSSLVIRVPGAIGDRMVESFGVLVPKKRTRHSFPVAVRVAALEIGSATRFVFQRDDSRLARVYLPIDRSDVLDVGLLYLCLFTLLQIPGSMLMPFTSMVCRVLRLAVTRWRKLPTAEQQKA